jgi:hypothetical protein
LEDQAFNQHLLCCLIRPPTQCPASTLHYDIGTQTAEDAGLVVFGGVEVRDNDVVWVREMDIASRADRTQAVALTGQLAFIGAFDAEDVTVAGTY